MPRPSCPGATNGAQINISGDNTGRSITDFETKQTMVTQSQNWKLFDNQIVGTNSRQLLIRTDLNSTMWGLFATTLSADRNLWWKIYAAGLTPVAVGMAVNWAKFRHPYLFPRIEASLRTCYR